MDDEIESLEKEIRYIEYLQKEFGTCNDTNIELSEMKYQLKIMKRKRRIKKSKP